MNNNQYELSPEENEKIFQENIVPFFTHNKKSSSEPTFVLLVGQPGAGKSSLSGMYSKKLSEAPVLFGADDLRALHPFREDIMNNHEAEYPFLTKKDSGIWREKLVDHAIKNNNNILIETILTNPADWKLGTVERAKAAGYKIRCVVLGVHEYQSVLGIYSRYEEQKRMTGHGFAPTHQVHDLAYERLPEIVGNMAFHGTADSISVYNRDLKCFYDETVNAGNTEVSQNIINAIKVSRNSGINDRELMKIAAGWEKVLFQMERRNAPEEETKNVREIFARFKADCKTRQSFFIIGQQKNKATSL